MTRLPSFSPQLNDQLAEELLLHSLALLPFSPRQDMRILSAGALRFTRPEPPRDPDLPMLPAKAYPRPEKSLVEATLRAMIPPPPMEGFIDRKTELDQAVVALLSGRPAVISGETGAGKTALLRQIAHDPRILKSFKRVWWLDDMADAGVAIGLALNAPIVLRANLADQPRLARDFIVTQGVLLIVDNAAAEEVQRACAFAPSVAVATTAWQGSPLPIVLEGLTPEAGTQLLAKRAGQPEAVTAPLAEMVSSHPRSLELMATLMAEDGLTPQLVADWLQGVEGDRQTALYSASFDALPEDYRALCRILAVTPGRWIALESVLSRFDKPLVAQRALTFLERRRFIERTEHTLRTTGNWPATITPAETGFTPIARPVSRFVSHTTTESSARGAELYQSGVTLIEEGRDSEAETALKEALELRMAADTDHAVAETLTALARLAYLQGDDAAAIRNLERAAERLYLLHDDESLEIVRLALSRVYRRAGRLDAALAVLGEDAPLENLVEVYRAREEWNAAIQTYQRWLEKEPDAIYGLAEVYALAGNFDEAENTLRGNETFMGRWLRAMFQHMQGHVAKALDMYTRIRLEVPQQWRAPFARCFSRALAAMGEVHDAALIVNAEGMWYEAKQPRPMLSRQRMSLALAAHYNMMLGRVEEAETMVNQARAIVGERVAPDYQVMLHHVMGWVQWQRGNLEAALDEFDAELRIQGDQPNRDDHEMGVTLHCIAEIQLAQGEVDRAIPNFRRAASHKDPSRDYRSMVLTRLSLREALIQAGRLIDATDALQPAIDVLTRQPDADLQWIGYVLALQAKTHLDAGNIGRSMTLLRDWMTRLAARINDALEHHLWGVRLLAAGLYLRSLPESTSADTVIPLDIAQGALQTAEHYALQSWIAYAAQRDLGLAYLRLERWQDAYATLAPLFKLSTDLVPSHLILSAYRGAAQAARRLDRIDETISLLDEARRLEPDRHMQALLVRETALIYRELGKDSFAAERYSRALDLMDREQAPELYVDAWVQLAYSRLRLRRFNDAIDTFQQALTVLEQMPNTDPALLSSVLYDMANAHFTQGQYRRAATTYRQALSQVNAQQNPKQCIAILSALAHSYTAMESPKQALEAYHEALQFDVMTVDERRTLLGEQAEVFAQIGLTQSAVDTYRAALALEGGNPIQRAKIHRNLGTLYAGLSRNDQASVHFRAALEAVQDEQTGITLTALGDVYRVQGHLPQAAETYKQAIAALDRTANPLELAATMRALGEIYLGSDRITDALPLLEAALEIEKGLPQQDGGRIVRTLIDLAKGHETRRDLERAIHRYHEALVYQDVRYSPEGYVDTLCELGRLYVQQGQHVQATKAYEEALGTEANQPTPNTDKVNDMTEALANVYRIQGRLEEAAKLYKQVLKVLQMQSRERQHEARQQPVESPLRERITQALSTTETDISRHLQTLYAAEQSWKVLNRTPNADLKGLAFVRALQAQSAYALGRLEESQQFIAQLIQLLRERRNDLQIEDQRPVNRALALLLQAQDDEDAARYQQAVQGYRQARETARQDNSGGNAALLWVLEHKWEQARKLR